MSGATPDQINCLVGLCRGPRVYEDPGGGGGRRLAHPLPILLRHVADDVRAFYQEAVASQPGPDAPTHAALADWIFEKTVFGTVLVRIGEQIGGSGDPRLLILRGYMIPEGYWKGENSWGPAPPDGDRRAFAMGANKFLSGDAD